MTYNLKPSYNTVSELITNDKALSVIYGRLAADGSLLPINIDAQGNLMLSGSIVLNVNEITPVSCVQPSGTLLNTTTNLSLVGGGPITLGQKLSAASLPVVLATDQSPIPVAVTTTAVTTFIYNEQAAVAAGGTATVVTYTVAVGKTFYLNSVQASGDTVGLYKVLNGVTTIAKSRSTYGQYDTNFNLIGIPFTAGNVLSLVVTNDGTAPSDFNGTIYGQLF